MKQILFFSFLFTAFLLTLALAQHGAGVQAANNQPSPSAAASAIAPYTVTDLGTLGGVTTKGMGINEGGDIAGASQSGSYLYGFLWDGDTMTNLGDLGGQGSWAYDVNETGLVVGGSPLGGGNNHAFLWQQSGGMQDLGTLGGRQGLGEIRQDARRHRDIPGFHLNSRRLGEGLNDGQQ